MRYDLGRRAGAVISSMVLAYVVLACSAFVTPVLWAQSAALNAVATLQQGLAGRCAQLPFGFKPSATVLRGDTTLARQREAFFQRAFLRDDSAHARAKLTAFQDAWAATSPDLQVKLLCYDYQRFMQELKDVLWTAVDEHVALPELQTYLTKATDTSVYDDAAVVAHAAMTPLGRQLYNQAVAFGDAHLYDAQLANLDEQHASDGTRSQQAEIVLMKMQVDMALGDLSAAERGLAQVEAWAPHYATYVRIEFALAKHDTAEAIRSLAVCRLTLACLGWHARDTATKTQLETLYRATHRGSLDGLDTVLAHARQRPELDFQLPITPWHRPNVSGERRVSVVQLDSWVGCPPCAAHTLAANGLKRRFGESVITLTYNYLQPLIPPNYAVGKSTALSDALWKRAHPTESRVHNDSVPQRFGLMTDGSIGMGVPVGGPLGAPLVYDATRRHLEERLLVPPSVRIRIHPTVRHDVVTATVDVTRLVADPATHPLKVHVLLVEDPIWIAGVNKAKEDGVVRAIAGDSATAFGLPVTFAGNVGTHTNVTQTFDLPQLEQATRRNNPLSADDADRTDFKAYAFHFDRRHLSVVAFVQDQITGEILQGAQIPIRSNPVTP